MTGWGAPLGKKEQHSRGGGGGGGGGGKKKNHGDGRRTKEDEALKANWGGTALADPRSPYFSVRRENTKERELMRKQEGSFQKRGYLLMVGWGAKPAAPTRRPTYPVSPKTDKYKLSEKYTTVTWEIIMLKTKR